MNDIPNSYLIIVAVLVSASILSKYCFKKYYYVLKLLPMIAIIYLPFYRESGFNSLYSSLILTGLLFSFAGDVLLLMPDKYFKAGLLSFLAAHLFYSYSLYYIAETLRYEAFVIYALFAWFMYKYLKETLDKLRGAVIIYITVISIMGAMGINQFANSNYPYSFQLLLASVLFIVSDTVLAINKFRKPFRPAELIILSTYYASQLLFAASV